MLNADQARNRTMAAIGIYDVLERSGEQIAAAADSGGLSTCVEVPDIITANALAEELIRLGYRAERTYVHGAKFRGEPSSIWTQRPAVEVRW